MAVMTQHPPQPSASIDLRSPVYVPSHCQLLSDGSLPSPTHSSPDTAAAPPLPTAEDKDDDDDQQEAAAAAQQGGIGGSRAAWAESKEKTILGPYNYVTAEPGKEFRTLLLQSFNAWLRVPPSSLDRIAGVVRMLHNASLLVDDIQDNSALRRGRPAAHVVFGPAQTINAANHVYFLALAELRGLRNHAAAVDVFTEEMLALHRGQGMDLFWRDTLSCPTEDDYLEMVSNKTGGLFRLAVKLMQAESGTTAAAAGGVDVDCIPLVDLLGLVFQITDDYKNLSNPDYAQQKGYCEDLTEGKFSFPVVHSIRADPANRELLHILAQRPADLEVKRHAVRRIEATGSFAYTRHVVGGLLSRAEAAALRLDAQCGTSNARAILSLVDKVARI